MTNALGLLVPQYAAPAEWNYAEINPELTGYDGVTIPRTGLYVTDQALLDALVTYNTTAQHPVVFLTLPPMGYSDNRMANPNAYYPTPALIAQWVSQSNDDRTAIQQAAADAEAAQAAAELAEQNTITPTEELVQSVVDTSAGDSSSALRTALDDQYVGRSSRLKHAPGLNLWFPEAEGAVGDGVADDTQAWLNAVAAAGGKGSVQGVPGVVYGLATMPAFTAGTIIDTASFKALGATRTIGLRASGKTIFNNVDFDFQQSRPSANGGPTATSYGLQILSTAAGTELNNCTLTNSDGPTLAATGVKVEGTATFTGCEFSNIQQQIQVTGSVDGVTADRCVFRDWTSRAIYVLGSAAGAASNVTITGSRFYPPNALAGAAQSRQPITFESVNAAPFLNVVVDNNLAVGTGTSHDPTSAQQAAGVQWGTADLISLHHCDGFQVTRNRCTDSGDVGITIALSCANGVVANNICLRSDSAGISAGSSSGWIRNVAINGNTCMDNGQNRASDGPAYANCGININRGRGISTAGNRCGDSFPLAWVAAKAYNVDDRVAVGTAVLIATVAGTSAASAPTAPATVDATVADGGVTWARALSSQTQKTQQYGISIQNSSDVQLGIDNLVGNALAEVYQASNVGPVKQPVALPLIGTALVDASTTNNATTFVASGISIPVDPNSSYRLEGVFDYSTDSATAMQLVFNGPTGSALVWNPGGLASTTTSSNGVMTNPGAAIGTIAKYGGSYASGGTANNASAAPLGLLTTGSTAGSLTVTFCQNTATTGTTIFRAGSWLMLTKVA